MYFVLLHTGNHGFANAFDEFRQVNAGGVQQFHSRSGHLRNRAFQQCLTKRINLVLGQLAVCAGRFQMFNSSLLQFQNGSLSSLRRFFGCGRNVFQFLPLGNFGRNPSANHTNQHEQQGSSHLNSILNDNSSYFVHNFPPLLCQPDSSQYISDYCGYNNINRFFHHEPPLLRRFIFQPLHVSTQCIYFSTGPVHLLRHDRNGGGQLRYRLRLLFQHGQPPVMLFALLFQRGQGSHDLRFIHSNTSFFLTPSLPSPSAPRNRPQ
nr:MAG TPA: hypothetical protein [Caudoviricetes sp.]